MTAENRDKVLKFLMGVKTDNGLDNPSQALVHVALHKG